MFALRSGPWPLMREISWSGGPPNVQDATFAVTWALDHAVTCNPGGINAPVRIAVLERALEDSPLDCSIRMT